MGRYRLFLSGVASGQCGMSTSYSYDGNDTLTVEWKGNVEQYTFRSPCAVYVETGRGICGRDFPLVTPLSAPHGRANAALWLCGIAKEKRCESRKAYDALCEEHIKQNFSNEVGYLRSLERWERSREQEYQLGCANSNQLYEIDGDGWSIARSTRPDCGGYYNVAAWADRAISISSAHEMVEQFGGNAPAWYVSSLLGKKAEG